MTIINRLNTESLLKVAIKRNFRKFTYMCLDLFCGLTLMRPLKIEDNMEAM